MSDSLPRAPRRGTAAAGGSRSGHGLAPEELLRLFDRPAVPGPSGEALALLAAWSGEAAAELADWPLGWRDGELLRLYWRAFGPAMEVHGACPGCGEEVELRLDVGSLLAAPGASPAPSAVLSAALSADRSSGEPSASAGPLCGELQRRIDGEDWHVRFRAVTSADLDAAAAPAPDGGGEPRHELLRRAVTSAEREGEAVEAGELPPAVAAAVAEALAELDPLAEVLLDLGCPACGRAWQGRLDVALSLTRSLDAAAGTLLAEVHALARDYGWSEAAILALSPARRRTYLEILGR